MVRLIQILTATEMLMAVSQTSVLSLLGQSSYCVRSSVSGYCFLWNQFDPFAFLIQENAGLSLSLRVKSSRFHVTNWSSYVLNAGSCLWMLELSANTVKCLWKDAADQGVLVRNFENRIRVRPLPVRFFFWVWIM
jgi:hypothetical protein